MYVSVCATIASCCASLYNKRHYGTLHEFCGMVISFATGFRNFGGENVTCHYAYMVLTFSRCIICCARACLWRGVDCVVSTCSPSEPTVGPVRISEHAQLGCTLQTYRTHRGFVTDWTVTVRLVQRIYLSLHLASTAAERFTWPGHNAGLSDCSTMRRQLRNFPTERRYRCALDGSQTQGARVHQNVRRVWSRVDCCQCQTCTLWTIFVRWNFNSNCCR